MIELLIQDRCTACNICVQICPTDVFAARPGAQPIIARQDDCQTCFMCELSCLADTLCVAPDCDGEVAVDEAAIVASGWLGQYRRHSGWGKHRHDPRHTNESWRMDEVFARARASTPHLQRRTQHERRVHRLCWPLQFIRDDPPHDRRDRPPGFIEAAAKAQEHVGFDRVLVAFNSTSAESILVSQHITSVTERLGVMIAHRPGFTAPTVAARQLATLDQLSKGRVAVHIITGGNDTELAQDGDHLSKDECYARTSEYLDVVRQEWTSPELFYYAGKYY